MFLLHNPVFIHYAHFLRCPGATSQKHWPTCCFELAVSLSSILVYLAQNCHYLPRVSSGHIIFFPQSTSSVPPYYQLNRVHISNLAFKVFSVIVPADFYPILGSRCTLFFSQTGFLHEVLWTYLSPLPPHFCTFAWAASYTRTLDFSPSPIAPVQVLSILLDLLIHHHLLVLFLSTTTCLPSKPALSPSVSGLLLTYCSPGL